MSPPDRQQENLLRQSELYGAPLGDSVGRVADRLDLSQAGVARVLGVSAPMLSQLVTGQRIKLGNPQAVQRLQALLALADDVDAGLPHDQVAPRLQEVSTSAGVTFTQQRAPAAPTSDPDDVPVAVSRLLRAVASGRELAAAAGLLDAAHPDLAELLRAYGTGGPDDARRHYEQVRDLVQG